MPIMRTERDGQHYNARSSHAARAHQQNATRDWRVVFRDDAHAHGRWTVITSPFGKLKGFLIIRGREDAFRNYYRNQ